MEQLELFARSDHERLPLLAEAEHLAVISPRRRGECPASVEPGTVSDFPGFRVKAAQNPSLRQYIQRPVVRHLRRQIGAATWLRPRHKLALLSILSRRQITRRARLDRNQRLSLPAVHIQQAVISEWTRNRNRRHAGQPPQLFACYVIAHCRSRPDGHHFRPLRVLPDKWRNPCR